MEKEDRTPEDVRGMISSAHASAYHWEQVGKPANFQRSEWMLSRVYSTLKRAEPALYHAQRCWELTEEHDLKDFDLGYAFEALARAHKIAGNEEELKRYRTLCEEAAKQIEKKDDREHYLQDVQSIDLED